MSEYPPAQQCTICDKPAVDPADTHPLCESHAARLDDDTEDTAETAEGWAGSWQDADFSTPISGEYPAELLNRQQWMGHVEKKPFAPWGDANPPDAEPDDSPRWEWGRHENYVDAETVAIAEDDPRLDGRVFLQQDADPFAFVDGDDVRDPATGDIHPAFRAILNHLGLTYADVSTSGSGSHAYYRAEDGLPIDGKGQATFEIDTEPWGANDSPPAVEIYANKHVCVATGDHVAGTPTEIHDWDSDALRAILRANGYEDKEPVSHDTDRDRPELDGHDPVATGSNDTAEDIRDVLKAVDRLQPRDLSLRTRRTGSDSTGWTTWDPSYRSSAGGESVHSPPDEPVFHDHKEGESFGVLGLFAAEKGIIRNPWDRLKGEDWWNAVDAARGAGASIPEFATTEDTDAVAILPDTDELDRVVNRTWDWREADLSGDRLTVDDARELTKEAIAGAYEGADDALINALPSMGKSYGGVLAAAETDVPVTFLTGRGEKEQYQQIADWAEECGMEVGTLRQQDGDVYLAPAFHRDCETARGDHGEDWAALVDDWYEHGATPQEIHALAELAEGTEIPCRDEGTCPWSDRWDFDPDEFDLIIGHYAHGYRPSLTMGRAVVVDEFPEEYESTFQNGLEGAVTGYLQATDAVPYEDYADLLENREDPQRRADALAWFTHEGVEPDGRGAILNGGEYHALAPVATFALLATATDDADLGNGYEYAELPESPGVGVFDHGQDSRRNQSAVHLLRPPESFALSRCVVGLDGTPTREMWNMATGRRLDERTILEGRRPEYVETALRLKIIRTTDAVKPYNYGDHVNVKQDAALLEAIADKHGQQPAVVTSSTALLEWDDAGVIDREDGAVSVDDGPVKAALWHGNVLGSNEFETESLGAVVGSNHYGDGFVKRWGAYAGKAVERVDSSNAGKGTDLSYGPFGDKIRDHMREHDTLQALFRFGRDGNGAVVYCHTNTLPDWVPVAGTGEVTQWSSGRRDVVNALTDLDGGTTAEIADHPSVDLSKGGILHHLQQLRETGLIDDSPDPEDGRRAIWWPDGLHRVNDKGEVTLPSVDRPETGAEVPDKVHGKTRSNSTYVSFSEDSSAGEVRTDGGETGDSRDTSRRWNRSGTTAGRWGRGQTPGD